MKKLIRSVVRLFGVLVVVAIVGVIAANLLADKAVRVAVEKAGTRALDVPVDVQHANLSILGGTLKLQDLTVANPPGYQQETLLDLERGDIRVDTGSLLSDTITIRDIKLDGMKVAIEQKGLDNNLREVLKSLREDEEISGKKLYVENLEITNISVDVKLLPIPGQADTVGFKLAPIRMTHLGRDERLDIATLATTVLVAVATKITEQGGDVLPQDMLTDLTGALEKALDIGRIIFGNGSDGRSSLSEALKNLLKTEDGRQE